MTVGSLFVLQVLIARLMSRRFEDSKNPRDSNPGPILCCPPQLPTLYLLVWCLVRGKILLILHYMIFRFFLF